MLLISGPCVIEDEATSYRIAEYCCEVSGRLGIEYVFKGSWDKANRSSGAGFRGVGLARGVEIFDGIKSRFGCRVTTDVHEVWQVSELSEVVDVLQVPALLCRQTDLVKSAAFHGRVVNVKKGQFMAPWDMANVVSKCRAVSNGKEVWLTERGTSFGYNRVVVDFTGLPVMKGFADRVIADCSHTVQLPCSGGDCSGGKRELVPLMARLGMAAGADGLFIEVHSDPDFALCDGPSSLAIDDLEGVLKMALGVERAVA